MDPADAACDGFYDAMVGLAHISTGTRPLQSHTAHTSDCNVDMDYGACCANSCTNARY